ncbi:MAG: thioredoxin family protein [Nitrospiraceae bacterium]|nr:thioredoxin family protein [Nitrospiraceae bacterium]
MLQRVYIQILDNPMEDVMLSADRFDASMTNKLLAEKLQNEMGKTYPFMVSVEYVDLFTDEDDDFGDVRELLRHGAITTPVVVINGVPRIYGGIPSSVIKKEVENILSSGLVH